MGIMVEFAANGGTGQGYLAEPASGKGPGIIVIQEWWGLVDHIKNICERFAGAGFTALAPDFYNGEKTKSPDAAGKLMMALNIAETEKTLRGAIDFLLNHKSCSSQKAGVAGFCMGGQLSLYAAAANPEKISACVDFYGIHPNVAPPFAQLKAPILGFFAENDNMVNRAAISGLEATLGALGKDYEFRVYPGTDHAFFNDQRPEVYNEQAAADTWRRMLEFFRANVKGNG